MKVRLHWEKKVNSRSLTYSQNEVRRIVEDMGYKVIPYPDGLISEILDCVEIEGTKEELVKTRKQFEQVLTTKIGSGFRLHCNII